MPPPSSRGRHVAELAPAKHGFSTDAALRVSVGLGATYLIMMIVGLAIVDRIGRRRLTLFMIPGAAAALGILL